jgi:catechol 2,3-dioxygenase-like lactoylglutathione lyase family enzyme
MTIKRMDHVTIVVEDLDATIAFFKDLGMALDARTTVEGPWVDQIVGLKGTRSEIAMMVTPDGHSKLELTRFLSPKSIHAEPKNAPPNTYGFRNIMFEVDDIDDTVQRLQKRGGTLVGKITNYEDFYRLCYLRGPEGILVALAEAVG